MTFGPLLIDLPGVNLTEADCELLQHPAVGGLILFARNIVDRAQVKDLVEQLRLLLPDLLITVDQEGGRVQRLQAGFTRLPALAEIKTKEDARNFGYLMASEVRAVGIDLSFAPVCDCQRVNDNIGTRAFHADPTVVAELAQASMAGMHAAGMAAVAKHFPGHGSVTADSHLQLPVDSRSLAAVLADDASVFQIMSEAGVEAMMPAHIIFDQVDPLWPVGFSEIWLKKILREQMGFKGVIVSDDVSMKAAAPFGDEADRVARALKAGCDLVLLCNNRPAVYQVLDKITHWPDATAALERLYGR